MRLWPQTRQASAFSGVAVKNPQVYAPLLSVMNGLSGMIFPVRGSVLQSRGPRLTRVKGNSYAAGIWSGHERIPLSLVIELVTQRA
jgi:hypothetical protein